MIEEIEISSEKKYQMIDITDRIERVVKQSQMENGLVFIFTPHSTAAVVITEDEPGLKQDWLNFLNKIISGFDFEHNKIDDNADSHILSGLIGQGKTLLLEKGQLVRGIWQQIFLVELDGPRSRKVMIKVLG